MRLFFRIAAFLMGVVSITTLQIVHATMFEHPASLVNVAFLSLLVILFVFETPTVVALSMVIFFIIDLYSVLTPFGIVLTAATISILLAVWLHRDIFTNRSWVAATGVTALCLITYRVLYISMVFLYQLLQRDVQLPWIRIASSIVWEVTLTSVAAGIIMLILSLFISSLRLGAIEGRMRWID